MDRALQHRVNMFECKSGIQLKNPHFGNDLAKFERVDGWEQPVHIMLKPCTVQSLLTTVWLECSFELQK